jgi:hypothetical protein
MGVGRLGLCFFFSFLFPLLPFLSLPTYNFPPQSKIQLKLTKLLPPKFKNSSNLTFSPAPGWSLVETEDWGADLEAGWVEKGGGGDDSTCSSLILFYPPVFLPSFPISFLFSTLTIGTGKQTAGYTRTTHGWTLIPSRWICGDLRGCRRWVRRIYYTPPPPPPAPPLQSPAPQSSSEY